MKKRLVRRIVATTLVLSNRLRTATLHCFSHPGTGPHCGRRQSVSHPPPTHGGSRRDRVPRLWGLTAVNHREARQSLHPVSHSSGSPAAAPELVSPAGAAPQRSSPKSPSSAFEALSRATPAA
jgi:hypothetical protein